MRKEGSLVWVGGKKRTGDQGTSGKGEKDIFRQVRRKRWVIKRENQLKRGYVR